MALQTQLGELHKKHSLTDTNQRLVLYSVLC
jgi:hypothetical protein